MNEPILRAPLCGANNDPDVLNQTKQLHNTQYILFIFILTSITRRLMSLTYCVPRLVGQNLNWEETDREDQERVKHQN